MSKAKSSNEINFIRHTSSRQNYDVSSDNKRDSTFNKRVTFTSNRDTCSYCGRSQHLDKNECPAKGKECFNCGLKNHFSSVCRKPKKSSSATALKSHQPTRQVNNLSSSAQNLNETCQQPQTFKIDQSEMDEYLRFKQAMKFQIQRVNRMDDNDPTDVRIDAMLEKGDKIEFVVDTGSPLTIISEETFESLINKPILIPCSLLYKGFMSNKLIPFKGEFKDVVSYNGKHAHTTIQVVHGRCNNLLSLRIT